MSSIKLVAAVVLSTVMGLCYMPVAQFIAGHINTLAHIVAGN